MKLGRTQKSDRIRRYLLEGVRTGRQHLVSDATEVFGLSRQTIHKHLTALVDKGFLVAEGHTRARIYGLGSKRSHIAFYDLGTIEEHTVHRRDFSFVFEGLPPHIEEICHYGFTEILNNAIDHSEGTQVGISAERDKNTVRIAIRDNGEGIFKRIARILNLPDARESILELSKGKLTTDPENHTGEGIFFTSRAFDYFTIESGDLEFNHDKNYEMDFLLHIDGDKEGTFVFMLIAVGSDKDLGKIFDEYSSGPDEYRFERTVVPVRLALYEGERLVSRSQAKRLLNRVERFRHVILDFDGVDFIGQAFADEVFRVFWGKHKNIELIPVNMSPRVEMMFHRALAVPG